MPSKTLRQAGEWGFLKELLPALAQFKKDQFLVAAGDDAAVLKSPRGLVISIDGLSEGTHFQMEWDRRLRHDYKLSLARALGWKLLGSALSDLAAMGGSKNRWAMIYLAVPPQLKMRFLMEFRTGILEAAKRFDCAIAGGDTVRAKNLSMAAAVGGQLSSRRVTRDGARPGDAVCVAGVIGDASIGLRLLLRRISPLEPALNNYFIRRFFQAQPLLNEGGLLARNSGVTSLMDLSDSLADSVSILSSASRVGMEIEVDQIPNSQAYAMSFSRTPTLLSGGEDYSLLFTVRPSVLPRLRAIVPFSVIGRVVKGSGTSFYWKQKRVRPPKSFEHFR